MSLRVCPTPGCPVLTRGGRCTVHQAEHEQARGTTTARGYGASHQAERRRWAAIIRRNGGIECASKTSARCIGIIGPDDRWDLGHNADRSAWTGPECIPCNRATRRS